MSWLRRLSDRAGGRGGRGWAGSVEDLLYDGESVRERIEFAGEESSGNSVVVTSHRLLAFTPDSNGENYRGVDLPNVESVRAGHEGERHLLWQGGRTLVYGLVLLAFGFVVDFESFVPTDVFAGGGEAAGSMGLGGLLGTMSRFLGLLARLDEFARTIGALLVLFGVFVLAVYVLTRERALVVAVAGDEPNISVPADDDAIDGAVVDLEAVLFGSGSATETGVSDVVTEPDDPFAESRATVAGADGAVAETDGAVAESSEPLSPARESASRSDSPTESTRESASGDSKRRETGGAGDDSGGVASDSL